ncbi:MAG: SRPBCC domain-containing protein [Sulfolobaceae archaeon]
MNKLCGKFLISDLVKTLEFIGDQNNFLNCIAGVKIINDGKFLAEIKVFGVPLAVNGELLQYEISPETLVLTIMIKTRALGGLSSIDIITKSKVSPNGDSVIWQSEYKISGLLSLFMKPLLESITENIIIRTIECIKSKISV